MHNNVKDTFSTFDFSIFFIFLLQSCRQVKRMRSIMGNCRSPDSLPYKTPIAIIGATVFILGISTNCIIAAALIRNKKLRKNAYITLVLLLSVNDTSLCVLVMAICILNILSDPTSGISHVSCSIITHLLTTTLSISLGQTLLICINRFLAMNVKPDVNKMLFHEKRKYITTSVVFLGCFTFNFSLIPLQAEKGKVLFCDACNLFLDDKSYLTAGSIISCFWVVNFTVIITMYLVVLYKLKRRTERVTPTGTFIQVNELGTGQVDQGRLQYNGPSVLSTNSRPQAVRRSINYNGPSVVSTNARPVSVSRRLSYDRHCVLSTNDRPQAVSKRLNYNRPCVLPTNSRPQAVPSQNTTTRIKASLAPIKTLGILLVTFASLSLPYLISCLLMSFHIVVYPALHSAFIFLTLLNTVANPILYTWRFAELRQELRKMFRIKQN